MATTFNQVKIGDRIWIDDDMLAYKVSENEVYFESGMHRNIRESFKATTKVDLTGETVALGGDESMTESELVALELIADAEDQVESQSLLEIIATLRNDPQYREFINTEITEACHRCVGMSRLHAGVTRSVLNLVWDVILYREAGRPFGGLTEGISRFNSSMINAYLNAV